MHSHNVNELDAVQTSQRSAYCGDTADKEKGISVAECEKTTTLDMAQFTELHKRRILRKIDWHLVPLLSFLYLVSFIDRGNREFRSSRGVGMQTANKLGMHQLAMPKSRAWGKTSTSPGHSTILW